MKISEQKLQIVIKNYSKDEGKNHTNLMRILL